jgi:NAD(P)-dependent dehydrogenase (short-subunit alcohol dehydrogenase family)
MIDSFKISGRNYIVTGAASGIGRAISAQLVSFKNTVIAVDKDVDKLMQLRSELNSDFLHVVTGDLVLRETRDRIIEIPLQFDGIVNSAGIIKLVPFRYIKEEMLTELDQNNYEAPVLLNISLIKKNKIKPGGSIVFISSIMSQISTQTNGIYTGTKSALTGITKTIALEVAPHRIRVNSVSPGFVRTPMLDLIGTQTELGPAEEKHPLGFGEPADVANTVLFLLSDASRWITGSNIIIDGGYCAR